MRAGVGPRSAESRPRLTRPQGPWPAGDGFGVPPRGLSWSGTCEWAGRGRRPGSSAGSVGGGRCRRWQPLPPPEGQPVSNYRWFFKKGNFWVSSHAVGRSPYLERVVVFRLAREMTAYTGSPVSNTLSPVVLLPRRSGCRSPRGQPEIDNGLGRRSLLRSSGRGRPCHGRPDTAPGQGPPRRRCPGPRTHRRADCLFLLRASTPCGLGGRIPGAPPSGGSVGRESAGPFLTGRLGR